MQAFEKPVAPSAWLGGVVNREWKLHMRATKRRKKNILNFLAAATRRSFRVELKTKKDARLDRVGEKN